MREPGLKAQRQDGKLLGSLLSTTTTKCTTRWFACSPLPPSGYDAWTLAMHPDVQTRILRARYTHGHHTTIIQGRGSHQALVWGGDQRIDPRDKVY